MAENGSPVASHRLKAYKNKGMDAQEMRRRREEEGLQLRKQKREEQVRGFVLLINEWVLTFSIYDLGILGNRSCLFCEVCSIQVTYHGRCPSEQFMAT